MTTKAKVVKKSAPKSAAKERQVPSKAVAKRLTPKELAAQQGLVVTEEAQRHVTVLNNLNVDDINAERAAVTFRVEVIKRGQEMVHDAFDTIVDKTKAAYDEARNERADQLKPFEAADRLMLASLNGYYTRQKQRARDEQERADREQAARESQAAIQRQQEQALLEERIYDQLAQLPDDAPLALIEKIQAPLEQFKKPLTVAPPVRVSEPVTSGGMTQQDNLKGEVIADREMDVLKQIIAGELPLSIIEFRVPALNNLAKVHWNGTQFTKQFDGIRFWNEPFSRGVGRR